jgi:outer membrane lipoprotein-sorting protein
MGRSVNFTALAAPERALTRRKDARITWPGLAGRAKETRSDMVSVLSLFRLSRRAFLALPLLVPIAAATAAAPVPATLTPQDTLALQRVAAYLNNIRTMTARFQQNAKNGLSTGHMWVARPGRMRFEYDPPNPLAMLADTFYLYYWDKQLGQISKVGLKSTPAWFLLRDPISFADVIVTGVEHGPNTIRVSVVESAEPDAGALTMIFTENPLTLRQWTVVGQQGRTTTVSLSEVQFGMALDPKLFQYQDPFAGSRRESTN